MLLQLRWGLIGLLAMVAVQAWSAGEEGGEFHDLTGQPQSVASYTGKGDWLVLMIWASDCHVCNLEAKDYAQFHRSRRHDGIRLLGLSVDGAAKKTQAAEFIRRHDLPFANLIGEPIGVAWYFAALSGSQFRGTPSFMVFGPDGELAAAQAGAVRPDKIAAYIERKRAHLK